MTASGLSPEQITAPSSAYPSDMPSSQIRTMQQQNQPQYAPYPQAQYAALASSQNGARQLPLQPLTPNSLQSQPPAPLPVAASPPTKRDLKSWWKNFKSRNQEVQETPRGIFGVPLRESITYANVAISLIDENGRSYIYGYVPIVVAKCGLFLKEKATEVQGIFRLSGSEKRIKELKLAFDSPDRYGKRMSWDGYTVHDAANVLRRYLNDLPEPVVPLAFYERFREPLRYATQQGVNDADGPQFVEGFDIGAAIRQYQEVITEMPPFNRQLLLYILDLLAVFASKADINRMNSQNLAAIFQPGILSHPNHAMSPEEYRLNQVVLIFLIDYQDHFLIGMRGTAADAQTVQDVERGTPPVTPGLSADSGRGHVGVTRTISNASAGAESVARDGMIRRNRSTSSRNSRHSRHSLHSVANSVNNNHVGRPPSPRSISPAIATTPTSIVVPGSSGLSRSNTLPARSPGIGSGRFAKRTDPSASPVSPLTPIYPHPTSQATPTVESVAEVVTPAEDVTAPDPFTAVFASSMASQGQNRSRDDIIKPVHPGGTLVPPAASVAASEPSAPTPSRERRFQLFQRSNTGESSSETRPQHKKLQKKRLPSSTNVSAQSSTASLPSAYASPSHERSNPLEEHATPMAAASARVTTGDEFQDQRKPTPTPHADVADDHRKPTPAPCTEVAQGDAAHNDSTPRVSQVPSAATTATLLATTTAAPETSMAADTKLPRRNSPSTSLHNSFNEGSDMDGVDDVGAQRVQEVQAETPEKSKKRRWRLSRRHDDLQLSVSSTTGALQVSGGAQPSTSNLSTMSSPSSQGLGLGSNTHAGISTSSVGSGGGGPSLAGMGALSLTGASGSSDSAIAPVDEGKDEQSHGKISGWLKSKYRGAKETAEQRRNKSPSPADPLASTSNLSGVVRGRSLDLDRVAEEPDKPSTR